MFLLPRRLQPTPALAVVAALVLLLGLPRILVRCSGGGDGVHVEFAHAPGACCAHEHAPTLPGDGEPALAPNPHCDHQEFAFEPTPAPRRAPVAAGSPPPLAGAVAPFVLPPRAAARVTRPWPATGPPRPGPLLLLRATTLLLL